MVKFYNSFDVNNEGAIFLEKYENMIMRRFDLFSSNLRRINMTKRITKDAVALRYFQS